jgi:hypothetical protein
MRAALSQRQFRAFGRLDRALGVYQQPPELPRLPLNFCSTTRWSSPPCYACFGLALSRRLFLISSKARGLIWDLRKTIADLKELEPVIKTLGEQMALLDAKIDAARRHVAELQIRCRASIASASCVAGEGRRCVRNFAEVRLVLVHGQLQPLHPDVQISRIRHSDRASCFRPGKVARTKREALDPNF